MEWAEWWGRYLNNLTSGKGRYPANSGITSMWTLWVARAATGIDITPELFPQTAQLLLLSTTARIKSKHCKDLFWKMKNPQYSFRTLKSTIFATSKSPPPSVGAVQGQQPCAKGTTVGPQACIHPVWTAFIFHLKTGGGKKISVYCFTKQPYSKYKDIYRRKSARLSSSRQNWGILSIYLRKIFLPSYISFVVQYPSDSVNASSLSTSESSTSRVIDTSKEQSEPVLQYSAPNGGKISVFTRYNVCQEENSAVIKKKEAFYLRLNWTGQLMQYKLHFNIH